MRAPFQILAIPYRKTDGKPFYCLFKRWDLADCWQFVAGGGEDKETPLETAKREVFEETGTQSNVWIELSSVSRVPVEAIRSECRLHWNKDILEIPEYAFGFECVDKIVLSPEHTLYKWLAFDAAIDKLKWESNKRALYELNKRLSEKM